MRQPVGHRADQPEVAGFNLEPPQLLAVRQVFHDQQCRHGLRGILPLERHDRDVVGGIRRVLRYVLEWRNGRSGLQYLVHLRSDRLRQVAEFKFAGAPVGNREETPRRLVRVQDGQVPVHHHARIVQLAEDPGHQLVVPRQLIVQPDVLHRQPHLLQQVEDEFQLRVRQRLARNVAVEHRHTDDRFPVEDRHRHLPAQQFKFLLRLDIPPGFIAAPAKNPSQTRHHPSNPALQRKLEMLKQARRQTDGRCGPQLAPLLRRRALARPMRRLVQEHRRAIDPDQLPQHQQELPQHGVGVQGVRQDGGEPAQGTETLETGLQRRLPGRGLHRLDRLARHCRFGRRRHFRNRPPEPVQQRGQHPHPDRLGEHVRGALQICFLLPLPLLLLRINENRNPRRPPPQLLENPDLLNTGQLDVHNACVDETVRQQRLGLVGRHAMDDAIQVGTEARSERFSELRMWRQHQ